MPTAELLPLKVYPKLQQSLTNLVVPFMGCLCQVPAELQMRGGIADNLKIFFLISLRKHML